MGQTSGFSSLVKKLMLRTSDFMQNFTVASRFYINLKTVLGKMLFWGFWDKRDPKWVQNNDFQIMETQCIEAFDFLLEVARA